MSRLVVVEAVKLNSPTDYFQRLPNGRFFRDIVVLFSVNERNEDS